MSDVRRYLPLSPQQFHILLALSDDDRHGYGIILDVASRTGDELRMGTGTLYTALARLLALDLVTESDREQGRRRPGSERKHRQRYLTKIPALSGKQGRGSKCRPDAWAPYGSEQHADPKLSGNAAGAARRQPATGPVSDRACRNRDLRL